MSNFTSIAEIPKVELHRHLEGSIRLKTLIDLYEAKYKKRLCPIEAQSLFQVVKPMNNLKEVIDAFMTTQSLLDSYENLEQISFEACEDAFKENIKILELRYAPSFINIGKNLDFHKMHEALLRGIRQAEDKYPIAVGLIGIIVRSQSLKEAERSVDFFIDHKETFVGIDLADQELGFEPKLFSKLFEKAKLAGLKITCHAGEEDVPEAPQFVKDAIDILGADRIGHGLQIIKNKEIMNYVKEKQIPLELCPTSNCITNSCKTMLEHPFKKLDDFGILVTLNSDDPSVFNINLSHEYEVIQKTFNYSLEDLYKTSTRAKNCSFISPEKIKSVWS